MKRLGIDWDEWLRIHEVKDRYNGVTISPERVEDAMARFGINRVDADALLRVYDSESVIEQVEEMLEQSEGRAPPAEAVPLRDRLLSLLRLPLDSLLGRRGKLNALLFACLPAAVVLGLWSWSEFGTSWLPSLVALLAAGVLLLWSAVFVLFLFLGHRARRRRRRDAGAALSASRRRPARHGVN